jgi:pyruvate/2-oxoglutarate dehydrogenase complex dihydrolipoamide dehydrogenase (E3) component
MIGELALAVQKRMTAGQLAEVIHPHPTINEMVAAAAK